MHRSTRAARPYVLAIVPCLVVPSLLAAQGAIRGTVTEAEQRPSADAIVHLSGTTLGARADSSGLYRVLRVAAGSYTVRVAKIGFSPESATVVVRNGETVTRLIESATSALLAPIPAIQVRGPSRMNGTSAT